MSQRFEAEQWVAAPLPRVFAFFADPHNLPRIMPPSQGATAAEAESGAPALHRRRTHSRRRAHGRRRHARSSSSSAPFPTSRCTRRWTALITDFSLNQSFRDMQKQGPFRRWEHTHSFEAKIDGGPRRHAHSRRRGVRSRLRRDRNSSGEGDIPAHDALDLRVSKARAGEDLSAGLTRRIFRRRGMTTSWIPLVVSSGSDSGRQGDDSCKVWGKSGIGPRVSGTPPFLTTLTAVIDAAFGDPMAYNHAIREPIGICRAASRWDCMQTLTTRRQSVTVMTVSTLRAHLERISRPGLQVHRRQGASRPGVDTKRLCSGRQEKAFVRSAARLSHGLS